MSSGDSTSSSEQFDQFWQASEYSRYNIKEFAAAQEAYSAREKADSFLEYPSLPEKLPEAKTKLNKLTKKRSSQRAFTDKALSKGELATLLSSFYATNGLEHRAFPSAGASYALEIFCVTTNVEGYKQKVLYYNPDVHGVQVLGDAPDWQTLAPNINVSVGGVPQCIMIFVLFPGRLTAKYLERGGRFALIEAGAALQQLALQIADSRKLKGVAVGGLLDAYWLELLKLDAREARVALGYVCGK